MKKKNYKENKKNFRSPILEVLKEHRITRSELKWLLKQSDSNCRIEIGRIRKFYPVLSNSNEKGYFIPTFDKKKTNEELEEIVSECRITILDFQSRIKELRSNMKPLIAMIKVCERELREREDKDGSKVD